MVTGKVSAAHAKQHQENKTMSETPRKTTKLLNIFSGGWGPTYNWCKHSEKNVWVMMSKAIVDNDCAVSEPRGATPH